MALSLDFLHWTDRYVGTLVLTLLQPFNWRYYFGRRPAIDDVRPERILVVKFWGIGSIALAGQTVTALRARYPDARIDFLTLDGNRSFLGYLPAVDRAHTLDIRTSVFVVLWRIAKMLLTLRRERYDLVVDLEFFTRISALVSFASGAKVRVGFHAWEVWRGNFHNIRVPFNRYWHVTRNFYNLGRAAGVDDESPPPFRLAIGDAEHDEAAAALTEAGVADDERLVLINVNAGEMALERRWPAQHFASVARSLASEDGVRPVFIGAPSERDYVGAVASAAGDRAIDLSGKLSIGGLLGLYARAAALVTNDTGPLQLALTQGLPTVSLFGPETPVLYGPTDTRHHVLYAGLACSPCMNVHSQKKVRCIHGRPLCLESITPDRVADETRATLRGEPGRVWQLDA